MLSQLYRDYGYWREAMGEGLSGFTVEGLTVGRVVHYVDGGNCIAATVTRVHDRNHPGIVDLITFPPGSTGVPHYHIQGDQEQKETMTWHWPERA